LGTDGIFASTVRFRFTDCAKSTPWPDPCQAFFQRDIGLAVLVEAVDEFADFLDGRPRGLGQRREQQGGEECDV